MTRRDVDVVELRPRPRAARDFGLVVGIDDYPRFRSLQGAVADAIAFHAWMCDPDGGGVAPEHARLVTSVPEPPRPLQDHVDELLVELAQIADALGGGRRLYVYFSGHGATCTDGAADDVALLLAKWSPHLARLALSSYRYCSALGGLGLFDEVAMFLDCCRSSAVGAVGLPPTLTYQPTSRGAPARAFIAYATEAGRSAFERPEEGVWHGAFTRRLLWILRRSQHGIEAAALKETLERELREDPVQRAHVVNGLPAGSTFGHRGGVVPILEVRPDDEWEGVLELSDGMGQIVARHDPSKGTWTLPLAAGLYKLTRSSGGSAPLTLKIIDHGAAGPTTLDFSPKLSKPIDARSMLERIWELSRMHRSLVDVDMGHLSLRSAPDVSISVYGGTGALRARSEGRIAALLPDGLYRIEAELLGRAKSHVIELADHASYEVEGPEIESPAVVIAGKRARLADSYSNQTTAPPLGAAPQTGQLLVLLRSRPPRLSPSEPVSVHDKDGHLLAELSPHTSYPRYDAEQALGGVAFSCAVAPGTYCLRASGSRRNIAITIPAGYAAQIFVADVGLVRLDDMRIAFTPMSPALSDRLEIARAMEGVLAALRAPERQLPEPARALLRWSIPNDLCFGIAAAHVLGRAEDRDLLDHVLDALAPFADIPDVAILQYAYGRRARGAAPTLTTPPLLQASLRLAMTHPVFDLRDVPAASPIGLAASRGYADSVWCTWSHSVDDERWIAPTIAALRHDETDVVALGRRLGIPPRRVQQALDELDAGGPDPVGSQGAHLTTLGLIGRTLRRLTRWFAGRGGHLGKLSK